MRVHRALPIILLTLVTIFAGCEFSSMENHSTIDIDEAADLRHLHFSNDGISVELFDHELLELATDHWTLTMKSVNSKVRATILSVYRQAAHRNEEYREESLPGTGYEIIRFASGDGMGLVQYVITGDGWIIYASASSRDMDNPIDIQSIDAFLLSFRWLQKPRPDREVRPAWQEYQQQRQGGPDGKFILYMDPAPILIGNFARFNAGPIFTSEDYRNGGRQINDELIEFYSVGDPTSIRVDVWASESPDLAEGQVTRFKQTLKIAKGSLDVWSVDEPESVKIESGVYDVEVIVITEGMHSERILTDREWFQRDDLERYNVVLTRRN